MKFWKIGLGLVLLDFVALSVWALATGGGLGALVELHTESPWAIQISCDLVLALSMLSFFVWRDARENGRNPVPWLVATLFTGSIAPLLYFVLRPSAGETVVEAAPATSG
jgi:hypothetical protein